MLEHNTQPNGLVQSFPFAPYERLSFCPPEKVRKKRESFGPTANAGPETMAIVREVAFFHGITPEQIRGVNKCRKYAWPRLEAYHRIKTERPHLSWSQVAAIFGRDHTTALMGARKHLELLAAGRVVASK